MKRWGRWGAVLAAATLVVAVSGCGQLFSQGEGPVTTQELASRVNSLDTQVGELQVAIANMGSGSATSASSTSASTASAEGLDGAAIPSLPVAVVEADVLNVRDSPSLTGIRVGVLLHGTEVNVIMNDGSWSEITYTNPNTKVNVTGWVDSDYLVSMSQASMASSAADATSANSATAASAASGTAY